MRKDTPENEGRGRDYEAAIERYQATVARLEHQIETAEEKGWPLGDLPQQLQQAKSNLQDAINRSKTINLAP